MVLTSEQLDAVRKGESIRLMERGTDLVVMRADVFDRLRELGYDAEPWTDDEMDQLASEDADSLGWEGMEAYQDDDK